MSLGDELHAVAEKSGFSGVVSVHHGDRQLTELTRGYADRAHLRAHDADTMFATASATKGLTALAAASLIESGQLELETTFQDLLGDTLPSIDPAVTIEHLLGHTSGVGDYLAEDEPGDVDDYVLDMAPHLLATPTDYLPLLRPHRHKTAPGASFAYNNSGYVMLSLAIEAASGQSFYDVVQQRVLDPADMAETGFLRSDDLPARAALGYLNNGRTNVFHLPVRGAGDGGVYSTLADICSLWEALFDGAIVSSRMVDVLVTPRNATADGRLRYGLGFWLRPEGGTVLLEGMDAGVSFRSAYDRTSRLTYTVLSNTSKGAWPLARYLDERLLEHAE